MYKSENIAELSAALVNLQSEIQSVETDATNPHLQSKFASLTALWEGVRPLLTKHGLAVIQMPGYNQVGEDIDKLMIETVVLHTSGQYIGSEFLMHLVKRDPQGIGAAISYGRRYAFSSILGLTTVQDDDGESHASVLRTRSQAKNGAPAPSTPIQPAAAVPGAPRRTDFTDRIEFLMREIKSRGGVIPPHNLDELDTDGLISIGKELAGQLQRLNDQEGKTQ